MTGKKKLSLEIIIPTLYIGGTEPKEPKYADIFYKDCEGEFYIYLDKWFKVFNVIETEYTPEQLYKIEQEKKENKTKKDKELEEYQQIIKMLKKLLK